MRISQLSETTGVPVATLKYYLREGLLPSGEALGQTRAEYGDRHVERVRLVRALVDGAGLSIADVRRVVAALEDPPATRHDLLGVAHHLIPTPHRGTAVSEEVRQLVADAGWEVNPGAPALEMLTGAVAAARAAGLSPQPALLLEYARAVEGVARVDLAAVGPDEPARALLGVAVGTVMYDVILAALRRLAQESLSAQRWGAPGS